MALVKLPPTALGAIRRGVPDAMASTHRAPKTDRLLTKRKLEGIGGRASVKQSLWFSKQGTAPASIAWAYVTSSVKRSSSCSASSIRPGCTARHGPHTYLGSKALAIITGFKQAGQGRTEQATQLKAAASAVVTVSATQLTKPSMGATLSTSRLGVEHALIGSAIVALGAVMTLGEAGNVVDWVIAGSWIHTIPATVALFGGSDILAQTIEGK